MEKIDQAFGYYKANKESLLSKYKDKFIVIVDNKVVGTFDDKMGAVDWAAENYEVGTFLTQHVTKEEEVIYFHSRVPIGI